MKPSELLIAVDERSVPPEQQAAALQAIATEKPNIHAPEQTSPADTDVRLVTRHEQKAPESDVSLVSRLR